MTTSKLTCDMLHDCPDPVTHVDEKGFLYCAWHATQRNASTGPRCRQLRPGEIKRLEKGETISYRASARRRQKSPLITRQQLLDAPPWTLFEGAAEETKCLEQGDWCLSHVEVREDVNDELAKLGVETSGQEPERDDEACAGRDIDDDDAALAALNAGYVLCKVPDADGSPHSRLLVVNRLDPSPEVVASPEGPWTVGAGRQLFFDGHPAFRLDNDGNDVRDVPHVVVDGAAHLIAALFNREGVTVDTIYQRHMGTPRRSRRR